MNEDARGSVDGASTIDLLKLLGRIHDAAVDLGPWEEIPGSLRGFGEFDAQGVLKLMESGQCVAVSRRIIRLLIEKLQRLSSLEALRDRGA